jgi:hypothetical protein
MRQGHGADHCSKCRAESSETSPFDRKRDRETERADGDGGVEFFAAGERDFFLDTGNDEISAAQRRHARSAQHQAARRCT